MELIFPIDVDQVLVFLLFSVILLSLTDILLFFVYGLLHPMSYTPTFWQMNDIADILARGSLPTRQTQCLKNPSKFWIFDPFWDPIYCWKTKNID